MRRKGTKARTRRGKRNLGGRARSLMSEEAPPTPAPPMMEVPSLLEELPPGSVTAVTKLKER